MSATESHHTVSDSIDAFVGGWFDPQVDRLKPVAEERQPLGALQNIQTR